MKFFPRASSSWRKEPGEREEREYMVRKAEGEDGVGGSKEEEEKEANRG